jgi:hypothetical protein
MIFQTDWLDDPINRHWAAYSSLCVKPRSPINAIQNDIMLTSRGILSGRFSSFCQRRSIGTRSVSNGKNSGRVRHFGFHDSVSKNNKDGRRGRIRYEVLDTRICEVGFIGKTNVREM